MSMSCLNSWVIICDQLLSGINSSACKYLSMPMHIHVTVVDWVAQAAFSKFTIQIDKWTFFIPSLMPIQMNLVTNLISICCSELLWMRGTFLQNWCGFDMEPTLLQGSKFNVSPKWNGQCWCNISKTSLPFIPWTLNNSPLIQILILCYVLNLFFSVISHFCLVIQEIPKKWENEDL